MPKLISNTSMGKEGWGESPSPPLCASSALAVGRRS